MRKIVNINLILGSFLLLLGFSSLALGDDIWILDFETPGGYSTSIAEFTDEEYDFFTRTDGSNIGSDFVVTNIQGLWYFSAQDIDAEGATLPVTLTIDDINISGYSDLSFYVFLAEDDPNGWDASDYVHIDYDVDNTGSFSNLLWIEGSGGTNTAPFIDTNFDGTGDGSEITSTFTEYSADIPSTGNTIDIKVTFYLDSGDEDIALDVLRLVGTPISEVADPKNFTATPVSTSQIDLSWTKNDNNDNVMVAWNSSDTFGTPDDGTSYSEGNSIPDGGTVLYNGSGTSYSHTSLDPGTEYFYKAWSVDGSSHYSSGVTADATTHKEEPTNHVTGFTAAADGWSKIDLSWAENDGSVVPDGYLIKASTSDYITDPADGTSVDDNPTIGDDSGAINLSHGTTSYQWAGLNAESTYYFKIYPYTNSGSAIDYKTDGTVPSAYATTGALPVNAWINEIHYDNASTDEGEFVEVVVPADFTGLSEITLTLYNGSGGASYDSHTLDGFETNGNTYANFKIYYKDISGIQNGDPDGLALDYQGSVIQFLSYEGTFTAIDGPASGMTSTDIGVSESGSDPAGNSLQLMGSGTQYSDFTWEGPYPQTKGTPNSDSENNQSFSAPNGSEELEMIPADFQLFPCYPNPFNPSTTIRFNIPEECYVTLKVYDLLGNLVITLIDQNLLQNQYNITWNGKNAKNLLVANGVYFYQLTTDRGFTSTKKMIFLR